MSLALTVGKGVSLAYTSLLALLLFYQRTVIFPGTLNPAEDPTITKGRLVTTQGGSVGLYFEAKEKGSKTLLYFHGNGDQLGWGPAYIGAQIQLEGLRRDGLQPWFNPVSTLF